MKQRCATGTICILLLDQLIKLLVCNNFSAMTDVKVSDFFDIVLVKNYGAAWGILQDAQLLLIIVGFITVFLLYTVFMNKEQERNFESIAVGILTGGILGNLVDRIFRGYVVDYLSFTIFKYDFPVFNLADMSIVIGVILLILSALGSEKYDKRRTRKHTN